MQMVLSLVITTFVLSKRKMLGYFQYRKGPKKYIFLIKLFNNDWRRFIGSYIFYVSSDYSTTYSL
ncbi:unnamed protein product [Rodentolepis nana]|uniref:Uncharacterized protein n=1 Tax=Rodentolepis nana TaxID=102285 RepID=A0A3P7V591_RODNA|nr:unnamed protein product [Rodentolepis nana]